VDGTANGLVFAGKGESCKRMQRENRECVTIHPMASFAGKIFLVVDTAFRKILAHVY
jgi:hypothetical protein